MINYCHYCKILSITYFEPDEYKTGGAYLIVTGKVKRIDDYGRQIVLQGGEKLPLDDIVSIDSDI